TGWASSRPRSTPTSAVACSAGARPPTAGAACSTRTKSNVSPPAAARPAAPRPPAGSVDITIESAITEIPADSLRFRGLDATRLAVTRTFEEVAELLWTGEFPAAHAVPPPHAVPPGRS